MDWLIIAILPLLSYILWRIATASRYRQPRPSESYPPIGVVIPVRNDATTLPATIESIRNAEYPSRKDIIIVDDGSDSRPYPFERYDHSGVDIIRHISNEGKRTALETGILETQARELPLVVTVDSDTVLRRDALIGLVNYFVDPRVGAVCGNVHVSNHTNFLTEIIAAEYWWAITFVRTGQSAIGSVLITSGCFSAFRNAALHMTDVWQHTNLAEDMDLSTYILSNGWRSAYALGAIAETKTPTSIAGVFKQRTRWFRGNIQLQTRRAGLFLKPRTAIEMLLNLMFSQFGVFVEIYSLLVAILANNLLWGFTTWFAGNFLGIWFQCVVSSRFQKFTGKLRYLLLLPLHNIFIMKPAFVYAALTTNKTNWN